MLKQYLVEFMEHFEYSKEDCLVIEKAFALKQGGTTINNRPLECYLFIFRRDCMIQRQKGCHDIYGREAKVWKYVDQVIDELSKLKQKRFLFYFSFKFILLNTKHADFASLKTVKK